MKSLDIVSCVSLKSAFFTTPPPCLVPKWYKIKDTTRVAKKSCLWLVFLLVSFRYWTKTGGGRLYRFSPAYLSISSNRRGQGGWWVEKWDRQKRWYQRSWNVLSRLGGRVAAKNAIICSTVVADCWLPVNQGMDFATCALIFVFTMCHLCFNICVHNFDVIT